MVVEAAGWIEALLYKGRHPPLVRYRMPATVRRQSAVAEAYIYYQRVYIGSIGPLTRCQWRTGPGRCL